MVEDRRAHTRIDELENVVKDHLIVHAKFEEKLSENTALTQQIANNTAEIVNFMRGAKGLRQLIVWLAPIMLALGTVWAWLKTHN